MNASEIFKKFGLRNGQLFARTEDQDEKVSNVIKELEKNGFKRTKIPDSRSYDFMYVKGAECVQVDYRNGIGYQSVYIVKNLPEVKMKLTTNQKQLVKEYIKKIKLRNL